MEPHDVLARVALNIVLSVVFLLGIALIKLSDVYLVVRSCLGPPADVAGAWGQRSIDRQ